MREYYIRKEGDEEASGPYNLDQITSLIEAGKLDKEAYVYDIDKEEWIPIEENEELMDILYPQKTKLTLQTEPEETEEEKASDKKSKKDSKQSESENQKAGISVQTMLAQAEGREGDDLSGKSPVEKRAQSAFLGLRFTTLFVLGSAVTMAFLEWDLVKTANAIQMVRSPYILFGIADVLLGIVLLLQVTEIYPLVRFRAAIGLGTLSILFFTSGDLLLALANIVLSVSIYFCTATLNTRKVIPFCVTGVLGLAGYIALVILPIFK
jgi:hypothetical protein